ncbi:MAG: IS630 family transposase [Vicinamibacterales bacterium]
MPNPAPALDVSASDRETLRSWTRSSATSAAQAQRARIILLASDGLPNKTIAEQLAVSRPTVIQWRARFTDGGIEALEDQPRSGRPRTIDTDKRTRIISSTLAGPPKKLGVTHWSSRLLARRLGVSHETVARVWREHALKPHRSGTFKFSTDPELEGKIRDIVGLYLNPPENAVVLCVDEKSQIQALNRTQPILPLRPGLPQRATHDYVRHGTTTLFAALEVATGRVTQECYPRHTHAQFIGFMNQVVWAYPDEQLHVVLDNYGTHKHPKVKMWLAKHPNVHLHFTPTSGSWLNLVEVFFSIVTKQAIRRGSFNSVADLVRAIRRFIEAWNERCQPFTWTKDADSLIAKAMRKETSVTPH